MCAPDPRPAKGFFAWADKAQALGYLRIESPPADAIATLWNMMDKYDDMPMDFCDARLVYLAISLKIDQIATTDLREFSVNRLPGNKPFTHVLAWSTNPMTWSEAAKRRGVLV